MTTAQKDRKKSSSKRVGPKAKADQTRSENKVPEWAENMEHSLRRLVREKEKSRSQNPGLYR